MQTGLSFIKLSSYLYLFAFFKAQLKRKTSGGGTGVKEETVESKASEEKEHQDEEVAPSSVELSRSPRTPARLAGATRVLPVIGNKEEG